MHTNIDRQLREARALESRAPRDAIAAYEQMLQRHPNLISARLRLSETWQRQGEYRRSLAEAELAADGLMQTRRWEALPFVTLRLLAFSERDAARRLIAAADWSHPAIIQQSPTLSQHLWLCGAYDEALDLIQKATSRVGSHPLLSYSRANALRYSGHMEEATEELEHCLAIDPGNALAHWSLAYHVPSQVPGSRVDRIQAAIGTATDVSSRIHLNYALFKELDDAGDTERAWNALVKGARLKRQTLSYDAQAESTDLAALHGLAETVAAVKGGQAHTGDVVPLFVVGMPRTGTTLLERILSNHEDVCGAGELGDFLQALRWGLDRFVSVPPTRDMFANVAAIDFETIGMRYLEKTRPYRADRRFMVDKNPVNVFNAWAIAKSLPQARILCLVRAPMDACFSNLKELFSGSAYAYSYDLQELAAHYRAFTITAQHWQAIFPEQFKIVRYEELVADPEGTISRVAEFCGLDLQKGMTDMVANRAPVLTASYAQVRQPIHVRNIGAWQRYKEQLEPLREALDRIGLMP